MPRLPIRDQVYLNNGYAIAQITRRGDFRDGWYLYKTDGTKPVTKFASKADAESFYYEWMYGNLPVAKSQKPVHN